MHRAKLLRKILPELTCVLLLQGYSWLFGLSPLVIDQSG